MTGGRDHRAAEPAEVVAMSRVTTMRTNGDKNRLHVEDKPVHDWYRFVLSFPPHLVRDYIARFQMGRSDCVLDPFCGTGTTLVECKKLGIPCIGVEAHPMAHFATEVKVDWSPDPHALLDHAGQVARTAHAVLRSQGIEDDPFFRVGPTERDGLRTLPSHSAQLLLKDSISPLPLHKTLVLLDCLRECADRRLYRHERLALAKALVCSIGNLHFGPEVGVGPVKQDAPVIAAWSNAVRALVSDLHALPRATGALAAVHHGDARQIDEIIEPGSVAAVITSPPYPNEKDYTRTTRLESVLLGFISTRQELRGLKNGLLRSNTRGVFKVDDDDLLIEDHADIQRIAEAIEARRVALGKGSGFERLYSRVTRLYFGGMKRHFAGLRAVLRPGAHLAYVVGDQASYLRVLIPTGRLLADIAQSLAYELVSVDLFRVRRATATKAQLREEVVVLRWPG
jgi:hypothetical protein